MKCAECQRPMRTRTQRPESHPGTVGLAAHGLCFACYRRGKRPAPVEKPSVPQEEVDQSPCVLVRTYITPAAFKALRVAGVDINRSLADYAEELAERVAS